MRVLVTLPDPDALADLLKVRRPELEVRARKLDAVTPEDFEWAETLVGFRKPKVSGWGGIRWIHSIGAGVDGILFGQEVPDRILVTRSSEDFGPAIGEYCVARALAVTQNLRSLDAAQSRKEWIDLDPVRLAGNRVLIVGTGMVGRGIARAFAAMRCVVDGLSRSGEHVEGFRSVGAFASFGRMITDVQWLVLALPRTAETRHLVNRERLAECHGAYLMNVGRGVTVEEAAIPEALDQGWISGAALDVFEREPLPQDSPLWTHPKVTVTPHCSGPSTWDVTVDGFEECLLAIRAGQRPRWAVEHGRGY
jgi:phosphoglycerate dehydrogenase-like enzyme